MYLLLGIIGVIAVTLFILSQIILIPSLRTVRKFMKLPGSKSIFLIGPIHQMIFLKNREVITFIRDVLMKNCDRFCAIWFLGSPMVCMLDPDDLKVVLQSANCTEKGWEYDFFKPWLKEGLLTSQGKKWNERRRLLTSTFHSKILGENLEYFWIHGKKLSDALLESRGETFCANDAIYKCVLDIICETAMNVSLDPEDKASQEYVEATRKVANRILFRMLNVYLRKEWLWNLSPAGRRSNKDIKRVHSFTEDIIARRRKEIIAEKVSAGSSPSFAENKSKKRQPFLDTLIEMDIQNPGAMTDSDIREEVDTFMYLGHDSTAGTLEFLLWELGRNEEMQERVYQEVYSILGDEEREITKEDLHKMNYMDQVIKEGLRLYPAAPYISRKITQDVSLNGGYELAEGFNVIVSSYLLHRNPDIYPEPEKFDPERFTPDEISKRHPFAYLPFSAGPRNCLGQKFAMLQLKVILSTLLLKCKFVSVTKKEEMILIPLVILSTDEPILMKVLPRKSAIGGR